MDCGLRGPSANFARSRSITGPLRAGLPSVPNGQTPVVQTPRRYVARSECLHKSRDLGLPLRGACIANCGPQGGGSEPGKLASRLCGRCRAAHSRGAGRAVGGPLCAVERDAAGPASDRFFTYSRLRFNQKSRGGKQSARIISCRAAQWTASGSSPSRRISFGGSHTGFCTAM
jgi:hypothetical protein